MRGLLKAVFIAVILSCASIAWAQGTPAAPSAQQAPAARKPLPDYLQYHPAYTGEENDIGNPHRTNDEISSWAQQAAADVLSFSKEEQNAKVGDFKKYFAPQGWQLYVAYLRDAKILKMVDEDGYIVSTIVSQPPVIVNRGATGAVYHWIVRMPITISFFSKKPGSEEQKLVAARKFYLFLDISRVSQGGGEDGIAIVNWRVMDVPKN